MLQEKPNHHIGYGNIHATNYVKVFVDDYKKQHTQGTKLLQISTEHKIDALPHVSHFMKQHEDFAIFIMLKCKS